MLPALRNFILPGGTELAARLHLARTVCRRAERLLVLFAMDRPISSLLMTYFNRLGDWLLSRLGGPTKLPALKMCLEKWEPEVVFTQVFTKHIEKSLEIALFQLRRHPTKFRFTISSEKTLHNIPRDIGQPVVAAAVAVGQSGCDPGPSGAESWRGNRGHGPDHSRL